MKVLVACEFSGVVRDAFACRGHDSWSCDLRPSETEGNHIQGDALEILDDGWDLMIAHPPCTHLARSGARWFKTKRKRQRRALDFFVRILNAPIQRVCVENPIGVVSTRVGPPTQIIQPYMFGHPYTKTSLLWLSNLHKLRPTKLVEHGPSYAHTEVRDSYERARTFQGIADAMAEQWGSGKMPGLGMFRFCAKVKEKIYF